jgi:tRNA (guanine10-N2)-methyltransferase
MANRYLLHFAHEHLSFRWPEFVALTSKNNCKFDLISCKDQLSTRPYILIELTENSDEANLIKSARESYLLKDLYELWATSKVSLDDLALRASRSQHFERCKALHNSDPNQSFKVNCETFGSKISLSTKIDMIDKMFFTKSFAPSNFNLSNPLHTYCIFQMNDKSINCGAPDISKEYYFGRLLARSSRSLVDKFSLKKRHFIANTSMDPLLSLVAANTAQVRPNDLVIDPFVGSGSLLVAAAFMGAHVIGSDIDWLLLHGKSKPSRCGMTQREHGECVRANLKQYGLESRYIDVMVSDISRHAIKDKFEFDSIIADPPYGVRESAERIGGRQHSRSTVLEENKVRFPTKVNCHLADLMCDLLNFSVNHLRIGGRLVYYLPVTSENEDDRFENFLPSHPSLQLVAYCNQQLTKMTHRLMVIMEKVREADDVDKVNVPTALLTLDFRGTYFNGNTSRNQDE